MSKIGASMKPVIIAATLSSAIQLLVTLAMVVWMMGGMSSLELLATRPRLLLGVSTHAILGALATAWIYVLALKVRR